MIAVQAQAIVFTSNGSRGADGVNAKVLGIPKAYGYRHTLPQPDARCRKLVDALSLDSFKMVMESLEHTLAAAMAE